jgi:hypothetical protein
MRTTLLMVLLALTACERQQHQARAMPREQAIALARESAQEAFQALSAELSEAISEGGPVEAISVCSEKAGPLLKQVAEKRGVAMIRLSDRPRNPDQEAEGADLAAIHAFRDAMKRGEPPAPMVDEGAGRKLHGPHPHYRERSLVPRMSWHGC